jgi:NADH dehydrogenase
MTAHTRQRILIVGGGFGGIYTAMRLQKAVKGRSDIDIALIDQKNYFVFQPLLPEVISGSIGIMHTVTPLRDLCPHVNLYIRRVESIDIEKREVVTSHDVRTQLHHISYDHLVLALGTEENFSMVRGLPEHGLHFKNLGDALALRNRLIFMMEAADSEPDINVRRPMLTVVMAGGGFSGVEAIAEVNDFVRTIARRYSHLDASELRISPSGTSTPGRRSMSW